VPTLSTITSLKVRRWVVTVDALTADQRRKLAAVYGYILSLSERRKNETADGETVEGDPSAASDPGESPEIREV
jgi:hypothetical protein